MRALALRSSSHRHECRCRRCPRHPRLRQRRDSPRGETRHLRRGLTRVAVRLAALEAVGMVAEAAAEAVAVAPQAAGQVLPVLPDRLMMAAVTIATTTPARLRRTIARTAAAGAGSAIRLPMRYNVGDFQVPLLSGLGN